MPPAPARRERSTTTMPSTTKPGRTTPKKPKTDEGLRSGTDAFVDRLLADPTFLARLAGRDAHGGVGRAGEVSGRPTVAPKKPKTDEAPKKPKTDEAPKSVRLTLGEHGTFTLEPDWTAFVAARCRRELGCTPEQIFEELSGVAGGRASIDTAVRLFVFAAWQCGADADYDALLKSVRASTPVTIDTDPGEDDSPEV